MTALSSAEPARFIDCLIATRPQAAWKFLAVYSALVGVHQHLGQRVLTAADCDRHLQRG
jgi:hypothetical protein